MSRELLENIVRIIPFVTTWIVNGFGFGFFFRIYKRRYESFLPYAGCFILLSAGMNYINTLGIPILNTVFCCLMLNLMVFLLFNVRLSQGILYNQLYMIVMVLCELLAMSVVSINRNMPIYDIIDSAQEFALTSLLIIVVAFIGVRILLLVVSRQILAKIRFSEIFILCLLTVFEIFVLNYMVLKSETMADVDRLVVTILGFFVLNAFIADAIRRMAELYKVRYEAEIIRQQSTLQLAHYNEMIKNYNRYRKVTHDVRKHLATLEGLPAGLSGQPAVDNGHYLQYSQTFLNRLELMFDEFECDSHILSIIMTQKLRLSKEHDIKNITRIENVDIGFMDDIDITAMFANLWDNAIEACTDLPQEKRFINMYLFTKNDMILIQFENSFNGEITERSGTYVSAKGGEHAGVGLQIIHDTAQKYGGHFITDVKNNIFTATVMLTRENS